MAAPIIPIFGIKNKFNSKFKTAPKKIKREVK